jgi:hypothetical protein
MTAPPIARGGSSIATVFRERINDGSWIWQPAPVVTSQVFIEEIVKSRSLYKNQCLAWKFDREAYTFCQNAAKKQKHSLLI